MFRRNRIALILIVLCLQTAPFLFAAELWGADWVFGGFLANPIDGASYLAKMQEGWAGGWKFTLLYSAEATTGAPLFLFYILLGHFGRVLGAPLIWVFHAARVAASLGLIAALAALCDRCFPDDPRSADRATWLAALGGGLGWLGLVFTGQPGADFWISEGYPFLSMFVNPHFPLGLALVLWMAAIDLGTAGTGRTVKLAALGLMLAVIQPFGLVIAALILGVRFVWIWWIDKRFSLSNFVAGLCLGGPFLLYEFWTIRSDPLLAAWNRQNLTPAPALWDLLLSFSPVLILAVWTLPTAWKERARQPAWAMLAGWLVLGLALVYLPFSLQRRFMTGLYVPAAFLAVVWLSRREGITKKLYPAVFGISVLTNIMFLVLMLVGPTQPAVPDAAVPGGENIYISRGTISALLWAREHTPAGAVILADAATGLWVPAWSGRRTVYGHPLETPDAGLEKQAVIDFYSGAMTGAQRDNFVASRGIDFILASQSDLPVKGKVIYNQEGVRIVAIAP